VEKKGYLSLRLSASVVERLIFHTSGRPRHFQMTPRPRAPLPVPRHYPISFIGGFGQEHEGLSRRIGGKGRAQGKRGNAFAGNGGRRVNTNAQAVTILLHAAERTVTHKTGRSLMLLPSYTFGLEPRAQAGSRFIAPLLGLRTRRVNCLTQALGPSALG
jgi:hypothetical protein